MDKWEVFLVIVSVVGFLISVVTVSVKISSVIQKNTDTNNALKSTIDELKDTINDLTVNNQKDHDKIFKYINSLNQDVAILKEKHKND